MAKITIDEDKFLKLKELLHILNDEITTTQYQQILFKIGIKPLVGVRDVTGYYTADTFVHIPEKSTAGRPYFEKIFSPFGFKSYDEALEASINQAVNYLTTEE